MSRAELDRTRLLQALDLAQDAIGRTEPNPRVGCVVGAEDGRLFGRGATQQAGGPHAEVMALRDALAAGNPLQGATAWVTLEPCAHHGRTPPCCDALIEAGIARVVVAVADPFAGVNGHGIARLRAAGVVVEMAEPDIAAAARDINIGFFSRVERGRPWVRVKIACSLDGRTALPDGRSQWITGPQARTDGHVWRRRASAVLTGTGTVLADDPRLDVRLVPTPAQPLRVIVDSRLSTPPDSRILAPPGKVLIVTTQPDVPAAAALRAEGAEIIGVAAAAGRVGLSALLHALGERAINEVHVEAGPTLNGALVRQGLVDELLVYQAPVLLGEGRPMAELGLLQQLAQAPRFDLCEALLLAGDLRLRARRAAVVPCRAT